MPKCAMNQSDSEPSLYKMSLGYFNFLTIAGTAK